MNDRINGRSLLYEYSLLLLEVKLYVIANEKALSEEYPTIFERLLADYPPENVTIAVAPTDLEEFAQTIIERTISEMSKMGEYGNERYLILDEKLYV